MDNEEQEQPAENLSFWGHLDALRKVLIRMAIVLAVFMGVAFAYMPEIFDRFVLAPCHSDFVLYRFFQRVTEEIPWFPKFSMEGFEVKLININLATQFFTHISSAFWLGLTAAFPVLLYLLWSFVRPALYPTEKRGARIAFLLGSVMFYAGVAVGYFVVFPITLRFLYDYHISTSIVNQLSLSSYMDNFYLLNLMMGVVFELPLLAWTLSAAGVLHRDFFKRYRRHAIVALLVLAAVITPTGDPFTLMVVFLPIYMLYELSAFLVKR